MVNHLKEILLALARGKVDFIVGGGVAAVLHGVERVTYDLDVSVSMQKGNLERFIKVMEQLKLKPRIPIEPSDLFDPKNIEKMIKEKGAVVFSFIDADDPLRHIDIFLKEDHAYDILKIDAGLVPINGEKIQIASREKIIELKRKIQPPRPKDLEDIAQLTKLEEGS